MFSKERIIIYPFDLYSVPFLRHSSLLENFYVSAVVSPNGWGIGGKDAGCVDGGSKIGMNISNDFDEALNLCTTVLFVKSDNELDFKMFIYPKILKSIDCKKNIICSIELNDGIKSDIEKRCEEGGVYFRYLNNTHKGKEYDEACKDFKESLQEINTPIIAVLGVAERTHKFNIQLALRTKFLYEGYKVSQIGSRNYCELLGFHSFPDFMYAPLQESKKIVLFNDYVKNIENEEKPDVIIIGIPGGIMPFNNQFTNKFGIFAYEVSQAITPDAAVLSVLYEDYKENYFSIIAKSIQHRLGINVDCFNLSNIQFDWTSSRENEKVIYTTLDSIFIDRKVKSFKFIEKPIFNILNYDDSCKMTDFVLNQLTSHAEIESF